MLFHLFFPRNTVNSRLDLMYDQIKTWQKSVSPMTDGFVETVAEATAEFRQSIQTDFENLKDELKPMGDQLMGVVKKNTDYYHTEIQKILEEFRPQQEAQMAVLKTRLEPVLANIETHAEETKEAMIPIINKIHEKVGQQLEEVRKIAKPYMDEYREHAKHLYNHAKSVSQEDIMAVKAQLDPLLEDVRVKFQQMIEILTAAATPVDKSD